MQFQHGPNGLLFEFAPNLHHGMPNLRMELALINFHFTFEMYYGKLDTES